MFQCEDETHRDILIAQLPANPCVLVAQMDENEVWIKAKSQSCPSASDRLREKERERGRDLEKLGEKTSNAVKFRNLAGLTWHDMQKVFYMILHWKDYQAELWQWQNCHFYMVSGYFIGKKVGFDLGCLIGRTFRVEHDPAAQDCYGVCSPKTWGEVMWELPVG